MVYSQTSFWDTDPSLQSSGMTTPPECCEPGQRTDGSPVCECTTEMCGCSIHPNTPAEWTYSMRDGLVRIFQSPALAQALAASEAAYGPKSYGALARYDRESCSWRIPQQSLLADSVEYSETWPGWGMTLDGVCYPLPPLVPRTYALDGGALRDVPTITVRGKLWPTPRAADATKNQRTQEGVEREVARKGAPQDLIQAVRMFPTPTTQGLDGGSHSRSAAKKRGMYPTPNATDYKGPSTRSKGKERPKCDDDLPTRVGGQLNPAWYEWLMGWPIGHTELNHWETGKSRSNTQQPTCCSAAG